MRTRRGIAWGASVLAAAILVALSGPSPVAAKGGKKPTPPPPEMGVPEIACHYEGGKGKDKGAGLAVYDLDGNRELVVSMGFGRPSWSPDGAHLAFAHAYGEIWCVDADGGNLERLHDDSGVSMPAWSPGGDAIAFAGDDLEKLYLVPAEGGDLTVLHTAASGYGITSPTWNAAGTHLAFLESDGGSTKTVRVIELSTGEVEDVTTLAVNWIEWARTADVLLHQASGEIFTMDMDTAESTYVTDGYYASWSPDDTEIVLDDGEGTLVRHDLATGAQVELGKGKFPSWRR